MQPAGQLSIVSLEETERVRENFSFRSFVEDEKRIL